MFFLRISLAWREDYDEKFQAKKYKRFFCSLLCKVKESCFLEAFLNNGWDVMKYSNAVIHMQGLSLPHR